MLLLYGSDEVQEKRTFCPLSSWDIMKYIVQREHSSDPFKLYCPPLSFTNHFLYRPFSFPTILVSMLIRVIHEITFLFTNMTFASLQRVDQGNSNVFRVSAIYVVWGLATPYNDLFYTVQKRFAGLNKRVCVKHLLLCCYQSGPFFV